MSTPTHVQFTISIADLEKLAEALETWETGDTRIYKMLDSHPELFKDLVAKALPDEQRPGFTEYFDNLRSTADHDVRRRKAFSLRIRAQIHEILSNPSEHAVAPILL